MDIIEILQQEVDKICEEKYKWDKDSSPKFIVSLLDMENGETVHKIMLTVFHCGYHFSRVIFPNYEYNYGYESVEKEMEWLFNTTM